MLAAPFLKTKKPLFLFFLSPQGGVFCLSGKPKPKGFLRVTAVAKAQTSANGMETQVTKRAAIPAWTLGFLVINNLLADLS